MSAAQNTSTKIGAPTSDVSRLRIRGRDTLSDVLGKMSFTEAFHLIVTGREANMAQRKVLDAALIILMDHGITPTAIVSRLVADSVETQPQVAVAAGLMMVGDKYAGTMSTTGEYLLEGIGQPDPKAWAHELVKRHRRLAGFGHPYYRPTDPRADRLFDIARDAGVDGRFIDLLHTVHEEVVKAANRPVTLNVTGALGAVLCEIGFPATAMRGISIVGRAAGLVAHVDEERDNGISAALIECANNIPYVE